MLKNSANVFRQVTKLFCMAWLPRNYNQSECNVVKQVARFCCPFHCSLRQVPKRFLLVLITKLTAERGGGTQCYSICKRDLVTTEGFPFTEWQGLRQRWRKNWCTWGTKCSSILRRNPIAYIVDTTKEHVLKSNIIDDRFGFQIDNQALKRFITKIRARFWMVGVPNVS